MQHFLFRKLKNIARTLFLEKIGQRLKSTFFSYELGVNCNHLLLFRLFPSLYQISNYLLQAELYAQGLLILLKGTLLCKVSQS